MHIEIVVTKAEMEAPVSVFGEKNYRIFLGYPTP